MGGKQQQKQRHGGAHQSEPNSVRVLADNNTARLEAEITHLNSKISSLQNDYKLLKSSRDKYCARAERLEGEVARAERLEREVEELKRQVARLKQKLAAANGCCCAIV